MTTPLEISGDFHRVRVPGWFRPFNPAEQVEERAAGGYERNLPHWRYEGATYFLTFRLADALPAEVVAEMGQAAAARSLRLDAARRANGGFLSSVVREEEEEALRQTLIRMETWLDRGHGSCVLRGEPIRQIVREALLHFQNERCHVAAFTVMPNHVHVICCPLPGWSIESLTASWKRYTARAINHNLKRSGSLWQQETYDRIIRDADHFRRVVRYLVRNPAKAHLPDSDATIWVSEEILPPARAVPPQQPEQAP